MAGALPRSTLVCRSVWANLGPRACTAPLATARDLSTSGATKPDSRMASSASTFFAFVFSVYLPVSGSTLLMSMPLADISTRSSLSEKVELSSAADVGYRTGRRG